MSRFTVAKALADQQAFRYQVPLGKQSAQQDYLAFKLSQWQHWSLMADVHGAIIHAHRPYMVSECRPAAPAIGS